MNTLLRDTQKKMNPKQKAVKPVRDNATRWLSQHYMIKRALRLRMPMQIMLNDWRKEWNANNLNKNGKKMRGSKVPDSLQPDAQLSANDWDTLQGLHDILAKYEKVVKVLEGDGQIRKRRRGRHESYGNSWDVILGFESVFATLEAAKDNLGRYHEPSFMRVAINAAWDKLREYYESQLQFHLSQFSIWPLTTNDCRTLRDSCILRGYGSPPWVQMAMV